MAQLVARLNGIQKARGSNPLVSTKKDLSAHPDKSFLYQIRLPDLIIIRAKGELSYDRRES